MALLRKDEYESRKHDLELQRAELRSTFTWEQENEIPMFRTMNGLQYKAQDDKLQAELEELERQWQITRYVASQRKGKPGHSITINTASWKPVSEGQYRLAMSKGDMVRTSGEGRNRKFEVME